MTSKDFQEVEIRLLKDSYPVDLLLLGDESMEAVNAYLDQSHVFGIYQKGALAGAMAVKPNSDRTIELKNISIGAGYQRKGLGSYALKWLELHYESIGCREIFVGTGSTSAGAIIFYQKSGFEVHSIKRNFFVQNYPDPIYENGIRLKHMIMFQKRIQANEESSAV